MAQMSGLKPCPFCGSGAVLIVEPHALIRSVWIECSSCRTTSPRIEYTAAEDIDETCRRLGEAQLQAKTFWNTRAHDHELQPG